MTRAAARRARAASVPWRTWKSRLGAEREVRALPASHVTNRYKGRTRALVKLSDPARQFGLDRFGGFGHVRLRFQFGIVRYTRTKPISPTFTARMSQILLWEDGRRTLEQAVGDLEA